MLASDSTRTGPTPTCWRPPGQQALHVVAPRCQAPAGAPRLHASRRTFVTHPLLLSQRKKPLCQRRHTREPSLFRYSSPFTVPTKEAALSKAPYTQAVALSLLIPIYCPNERSRSVKGAIHASRRRSPSRVPSPHHHQQRSPHTARVRGAPPSRVRDPPLPHTRTLDARECRASPS